MQAASTLLAPSPALEVADLRVRVTTPRGLATIVDGVSFGVARGSTLGIVGESGSGKSVTCLSLLGLLDGRFDIEGRALVGGDDLLGIDERTQVRMRGGRVGYVFQDALTSLNPVRPIGVQVTETIRRHLPLSRKESRSRAVDLLAMVELKRPSELMSRYPHELSGGMRQRVMIAIALAGDPEVLIADECTTALDVTVQQQIIELVQTMQADHNLAVVWISHDLGVVAQVAHEVAVMYAGQILERGPVADVLKVPGHPYTQALLASHPKLEPFTTVDALPYIAGRPPDIHERDPGCVFWHRCPHRLDERCATERPPLREIAPGHEIATFCEVRVA